MKDKFSSAFKKAVAEAVHKSDLFYKTNSNLSTPNPHFVGFGNPNSKVLIIGKELGFDENNLSQLRNESINNPYQWKQIIENTSGSLEFNPEFPYGNFIKKKEGSTWNKYEKLNKLLAAKHLTMPSEIFKKNFFFTEMNSVPSKYSKGLSKEVKLDRIKLFKEGEFFQEFKVVILAFGNYLSSKDIQEIFNVGDGNYELSKSRNKLIVFYDQEHKKVIVHTRQLSADTSDELLQNIAKVINESEL